MKKGDLLFLCVTLVLFVPFFVSDELYGAYREFNSSHGMLASFFKFAVLSTLGELLGLRISSGSYYRKGFGVMPRAFVWGIFGMAINMAFVIFSTGIPAFAGYLGVENPAGIMSGNISVGKVVLAFAVSVAMNSIFAPVFMTLHKITDTHILATGGTMRGLFSPIPMGEILQNINWKVQWGFVFKKTIPLFWFPAHTVTFLLPEDMRVIFAALLGVVLGLILAVAARRKD
ncbi:MAG: hypothetical protein BHV77_03215 [Bacteroides sp. 43_108]|nr:MAG: hypothetical protein BHV77_03215 [Bacteroides sp. 43_108]